jgi:hypothetical protein
MNIYNCRIQFFSEPLEGKPPSSERCIHCGRHDRTMRRAVSRLVEPLLNAWAMANFPRPIFPRRGGRVVDGSGLENRQSESSRGFESHPLRSYREQSQPAELHHATSCDTLEIRAQFDWRGALRAGVKSGALNPEPMRSVG